MPYICIYMGRKNTDGGKSLVLFDVAKVVFLFLVVAVVKVEKVVKEVRVGVMRTVKMV